MLIYSIEYYLSKGSTLDEANSIIQSIKDKGGVSIKLSCAKRRIAKFNLNIDVETLLNIEQEFFTKHPTFPPALAAFHKYVMSIRQARNESFVESVNRLSSSILKFPKLKKHKNNTEFNRDLFGEDSTIFKVRLDNLKNYITCNFEKFAESYDDKELAKIKFKEKYGSNNIEGIMIRHNVSAEVAEEMIKARSDKGQATYNLKSDDEKLVINKKKSNSLGNLIIRHGEVEGTIRYKELCDFRNYQCTLQYYIDKFGETEGIEVYELKKGKHKSYYCKEYWIAKGLSDKEAVDKVEELFSVRPNFSLKYCIERYGMEEGTSVWIDRQNKWQDTLLSKSPEEIADINKRKAHNLENYILRYGSEEGLARYNLHKEHMNISRVARSSREANLFFVKLYKLLRKSSIISRSDVYFGVTGSKEYFINLAGNVRFYDFTIPTLNVIIEYNGVAFHPREGDTEWVNPYGVLYDVAYANDVLKLKMAKEREFNLLYVWSDENLHDALIKCFNYIENLHKDKQ